MDLDIKGRWAAAVLSVADNCDSWNNCSSPRAPCVPLYCSGVRVGRIKPNILKTLASHPAVFEVVKKEDSEEVERVQLSGDLKTVQERTVALNRVFAELRDNGAFLCLKGWRNEDYAVSEMFSSSNVLFHCERAAAKLLGVRQYGIHVNGYVVDDNGEIKIWIGRRSPTKATYPGLLDNTVAGGIAAGSSPLETLVKECEEEASIPADLAQTARPVGTISYCHETEEGILPETEFMYDLHLPPDFIPTPLDGEVSNYYLWSIDKIKEEMVLGHFKPNSSLVVLKFMIRHGLLSPESEPLYEVLASCGHLNHFKRTPFNTSSD